MTYQPVPQPTINPRAGIGVLPPFMRPLDAKPVYTPAETKSPAPQYYILEKRDAGIFKSLAAIDAYIHKDLNGTVRYDTDLLPRAGDPTNPLQFHGHLVEQASISNPHSAGRGFYMFSSDDLATKVETWTYNYLNFLDTAERWLGQQNDFYLSYLFLTHHPVFYHRRGRDSDDWEQSEGLQSLWQDVFAGETPGSATFSFEHGSYDDETKTVASHDHWLDAWGDTYEAAIIQLAGNVHKYYDLLGMDRNRPRA